MSEIVVIGGGVIGLSSAYYLNKAGYNVTVIERGDITDGCSFGNMGYISPSHFVPLASPGIISQGLKWMLSPTSPFYIKPRLNLDLMQWGYHFWKSSNAATVEKNSPHLNNILQLSRKLINDLRNDIGNTFDMEEIGCLMMCKQQKTLDHEFHMADDAEMLGLKVERLVKEDVQKLEPNVEVNVAGAVLFKDDCHFNPGKMMVALKDYLDSKGVQFKLNTTVTGFEKAAKKITAVITDKGKITCDEVIVATGSWLPEVVKMMGIKLLLQPGKGYSYTYPSVEKNIKYPAILVDGRCAITPWGNQLRIGGTMELSGINDKVLVKRMQGIYDSALDFYPGLKIDFPPADKIWSGLRPVTPDGLPYIGKHHLYDNVVIAGGHAMLGISEGTGTGKLVTEIIQRKTTSINISAFKVERF
ncbi:NAD(P)/FAD-dependent oxidoreductase [Ferruginibacter sp. SUN106]|uniref:NAD(P)/FAD-dependent oxidoreductase n=1 Tax=Ferruginibacter sp. SUN106 TaxID=2978348 RepID=UPI003D35C89B